MAADQTMSHVTIVTHVSTTACHTVCMVNMRRNDVIFDYVLSLLQSNMLCYNLPHSVHGQHRALSGDIKWLATC